jgi:hypothetical protein
MATISSCLVYVPARDFALAQRFYAALGFALKPGWGGTVDCELGAMRFRLQDYFVEDWAGNFMFVVGVDDAQAWYDRAAALKTEFPTIRVKPPEPVHDDRDGTTDIVTHVVDPSGVLLVLVQDSSVSAG